MANPYLQVDGLTKSFGDLVLFENISFGVAEGQRIGLIAKNGTGKTTLLNILSGKEGYDEGSIVYRRDLRVGYLEQDPQYPEDMTVLEACFYHGTPVVQLIKEYERCMETAGNPGLEELLTRMEQEKAWDYERKAKQILSQLKIRNFDQRIKHLSGGQLKRVALANALITEPDFLILDEPTNDLDIVTLNILEEYLKEFGGSLIIVSHDRYFLDRLAVRTFAFEEDGYIGHYIGGYTDWYEQHREKEKQKEAAVKKETAERRPKQKKLKFSYKEAKEYETIEETIAGLEEKLAALEEEMNSCGADFGRLSELSKEKEQLDEQLLEKMDRWEYLEELAARIEAGEMVEA